MTISYLSNNDKVFPFFEKITNRSKGFYDTATFLQNLLNTFRFAAACCGIKRLSAAAALDVFGKLTNQFAGVEVVFGEELIVEHERKVSFAVNLCTEYEE